MNKMAKAPLLQTKHVRRIPYVIFSKLTHLGLTGWIPDKPYLKIMYHLNMGKKLNLDNPLTYNEKLQWLKLYDRNPAYTMMVDKYRVREYVAEKIGADHLIPLLGVWERAEDIDFDSLPDQFVLKCNHDSGSVIVCKDKSKLDKMGAVDKLRRALIPSKYYWIGREWPYKNVQPCVIAEKYMADDSGVELKDYKFMCFNGRHLCTFTVTERFTKEGMKVTFFDKNWQKMPFERHYPASSQEIQKPKHYCDMVHWAELLSKNIPFARIDFYEADGKVYFGEITFFPGNGTEEFTPESWDRTLGDWLQLPSI